MMAGPNEDIDEDRKAKHGTASGPLDTFVLSQHEKCKIAQAKFVLYSPGHQTKSVLTNPYFNLMLQESNFGKGSVPILGYKQLLFYARAEYNLLFKLVNFLLDQKEKQGLGNHFAQVLHNGCTASNRKKYQAIGLQFIDPKWRTNHVLCIGFTRCSSTKAQSIADLIEVLFKDKLNRRLASVANLMVSDGGAKKVSKLCNIDESETCDMHDADKIGQSATGKLVRSHNHIPVNPFEGGLDVIKKAHAIALWFNVGERTDLLFKARDLLGGKDIPRVRLQLDLNSTRIAAQHRLLFSILRMNKSIKYFELQCIPDDESGSSYPRLTSVEWLRMEEIESVLFETQKITLLAQNEQSFCGAYGPIIQMKVLQKLLSKELSVIDVDKIASSPELPRVERHFDSFDTVGRQCWLRAIVELERRF